jgi:hypothetical protein
MIAKSRVILSKVERAKKHIEDLHASLEAFWKTNPNRIRFQDDVKAGERSYYLVTAKDIPLDILNVIGDALHNLRSALDHTAYAFPLATGGKRGWNQFPIVDSAAKYMSADVRGKVQTFREDVVKALDALKPYKGGNDTLWRLHELNKIDKHRLLLTASITNTARSMTPTERSEITIRFTNQSNADPLTLVRALKGITPVPLNAGDKIYTVPHSEMEQYMQFHFDVAFNEPQIIQCKPVIETLHEMAKIVGHIVLEFDPFLT